MNSRHTETHTREHVYGLDTALVIMSDQTPSSDRTRQKLFGDCWSCRILSGGGLLVSGGYVYMQARKTMRLGGPTSMGTIAQIVFAAGLSAWGIVVLADPVGKASRKS